MSTELLYYDENGTESNSNTGNSSYQLDNTKYFSKIRKSMIVGYGTIYREYSTRIILQTIAGPVEYRCSYATTELERLKRELGW